MSVRAIRSIVFEEGGVTIDYMTLPDDVRNAGRLVCAHSLAVGPDDEYIEGIEALTEAAKTLLEDALDDFVSTPAVDLPEGDDLDEEMGS